MTNNQKAIDAFFEGYGNESAKEYGKTFFDLISMMQNNKVSEAFLQDTTGKLSSLFNLITEIQPTPQKEVRALN